MVKILTEEEKQKEKKILVDYLVKHVNVSQFGCSSPQIFGCHFAVVSY